MWLLGFHVKSYHLKPWVLSLTPQILGMVICAYNPTLRRWMEKDSKFNVIINYMLSLR